MTEMGRGVDLKLARAEVATACPSCGEGPVETESYRQSFPYGDGDSKQMLSAEVPLHICRACGFEYFDEVAEQIRHEAVCAHLKLLSPSEIRAIRGGLSRSEFCKITRIGEATLARWERGELLQNAAYDQFLRLSADPEIIARLRSGGLAARERTAAPGSTPRVRKRFRSGLTAVTYEAERVGWKLRKVG
jgi:putative zinc finger/helix-turn-helix YgiT family protein